MSGLATAGFSFAAGCALAGYVLPSDWLYYAAAALALPFLGGLVLLRREARVRCAIICIFAAVGLVWYGLYSAAYLGTAAGFDGTTGCVTVRVGDYPYRDGNYAGVHVTLAEEGLPRLGIDVADYTGTLPELRPGDIAELELEFMDARTRYGEETGVYTARGTQLRAYYTACHGSERDWVSALYFPLELMARIRTSITANFPEDVRSFMLALLIGDTHGVYDDYALDNALSLTGTAHVISVSGMHLSFLYSALCALLGKRRAAAAGAPLIILFTLMAGCSSAIVRACVMLLMSMGATLLGRESDGLTGLSASLLLLLAANPMSIESVSLQLSFASMLGIVTVSPALEQRLSRRFNRKGMKLRRTRSAVIASVSSSLGAVVFTTPIVAAVFGYVSLISPIANLLTLWAVSLAFNLGFAAAALGALVPLLGTVVAWAAAWPARLFVFVIELLARVPFAAVYTADRLIVWWLVFTYAVFIAAFAASRRPRPGKWKRPMRPAVPALCSALMLSAVLLAAHVEAGREHSVTVLDVGQGECVVMLSGERTVVVDCGGVSTWDDAGDTASEFLLGRGRTRADALILTHLHTDHAGGAARLLSRIDVDTLYIPAGADDSDAELEAILAEAQERGTGVVLVGDRDVDMAWEGFTARILAPVGDGGDNERGLVVCASVCGYDAVITGDAGAAVERIHAGNGSLPCSELLVAGHHGSRYSNSFALLDAVRPETVVISVGYNSYGHPTEEAMARMKMAGAEVYRTDENGNVTIRIDENGQER